jgi:DNA-binding NtrC family response regulator
VDPGRSLLLVASDARSRLVYRSLFSAAGWRVFSVLDVVAGLDVLASHAIDAVLVLSSGRRAVEALAVVEALDVRVRRAPVLHLVSSERGEWESAADGARREAVMGQDEDETAIELELDEVEVETSSRVRPRRAEREAFAARLRADFREALARGLSADDAFMQMVAEIIEYEMAIVPASLREELREALWRMATDDPCVRMLVDRARSMAVEKA